MTKPILTVTLNPAIDKTVRVPGFRPGRDFRTNDIHLSPGGKGINVSQVLHTLRYPTVTTGFLAGTSGRMIQRQLKEAGVRHDFMFVPGETRTSLTMIEPRSRLITRLLEYGPKITPRHFKEFKTRFETMARKSGFVVLSGRNAHGLPDNAFARLIRAAKRHGIPVLLDTSGPALLEGLKARPFIIKPNRAEAQFVLGKKLDTLKKLKRAVAVFHGFGVAVVILSMGNQGAIFSTGKLAWLASPPKLRPRNTVGCGDALIAGFLAAYLQKKDFVECVRCGVAAGAANTQNLNPGQIRFKDYLAYKRDVRLKLI